MHMGYLVGPQECKIMRLLPIEGGSHLYRIKCAVENFERVAKEGELVSEVAITLGASVTRQTHAYVAPNEKATRRCMC
jgi:hypothetical protein